jgi:hypothetical protein
LIRRCEWRTSGKIKSHAGFSLIVQNMFILNALLILIGRSRVGRMPLRNAGSYFVLNGDVRTVESSNYITKFWMKGGEPF